MKYTPKTEAAPVDEEIEMFCIFKLKKTKFEALIESVVNLTREISAELFKTTLFILRFEIWMVESMLDFPVMDFSKRRIPTISFSGVGLLMFFLETFEILMKPKSTIDD